MKIEKKRLDLLVLERGLASTRERAQGLILAGRVLVNDEPRTKPGEQVAVAAQVRVRGEDLPYVSRGGFKLGAALDAFEISVKDQVALDIGASTGGFTHVLLLRDVKKVFAIDVGHSQMDWKIRQDPRVVVKEKLNARYIEFDAIGEKVDIIVIDVSFISLEKIIPSLLQFTKPQTNLVTLVKPQFEVGKEKVGKKGIVTSPEDQQEVLERITCFAETLGLKRIGLIESPIMGTQGNKEFLAHWQLRSDESSDC